MASHCSRMARQIENLVAAQRRFFSLWKRLEARKIDASDVPSVLRMAYESAATLEQQWRLTNQIVAAGWDPKNPKTVERLVFYGRDNHSESLGGAINRLTVLPDGRIITADEHSTIRQWRIEHGEFVHVVIGVHDASNVLELHARPSPDGRIASVDTAGAIILWEPQLDNTYRQIDVGHVGPTPCSVQLLSHDRLVSGDRTGRILLWDRTGEKTFQERLIGEYKDPIETVKVCLDESIFVGTEGGVISRLLPLNDGLYQQVEIGQIPEKHINVIQVLNDGRIIVAAGSSIYEWKMIDGHYRHREMYQHPKHDALYAMQYLPDGDIVIGGSDFAVTWLSPRADGTYGSEVIGLTNRFVFDLQVLQDGSIYSVGADCRISFWNGDPVDWRTVGLRSRPWKP